MTKTAIDQAFVLAAGFGTRLRPLTESMPKPLLPVVGRPLLGRLLDYLADQGVTRVGVNAHHLADQIKVYLEDRSGPPGVVYYHEAEIMGTGGGLGQAWANFSSGPLVAVNGDVVFDFDLGPVIEAHLASGADVTMLLHDRPGLNQVLVEGDRVVGFRDDPAGPAHRHLAYTCVQIVDRAAFGYLPRHEPGGLIEAYRSLLAAGGKIGAAVIEGRPFWSDMGTPGDYLDLHRQLMLQGRAAFGRRADGPIHAEPGAEISSRAEATGFASLSAGAVIEAGAAVEDVVLLPGAVVQKGAMVRRSILGPGAVVSGRVEDAVVGA